MTNFFQDREITHETEFNGSTEIVFDSCTVPLNVEIEKFTNEKFAELLKMHLVILSQSTKAGIMYF